MSGLSETQEKALNKLLRSLTAKGARKPKAISQHVIAFDQGYAWACQETARKLREILAPNPPA